MTRNPNDIPQDHVLLIHAAGHGKADDALTRLFLAECPTAEGLSFHLLAETDDLRSAMEHRYTGKKPLAILVAGNVLQPVALARIAHRFAPDAYIMLVADASEHPEIRRQLGPVPMLGFNWSLIRPDRHEIKHKLINIRRATLQRRQVQTTIRRMSQTLDDAPRPIHSRRRWQALSDHYLANILTHGFDAVVCFGSQSDVVTWNRAAEQLFGIPEEMIIGRTSDEIARNGQLREVLPLVAAVRHDGTDRQGEITYHHPREGDRDIAFSASPVRDEHGHQVGVAVIARDITERKRHEANLRSARDEARDANAAKDRFIALLSHELRTPLTPALALLDNLLGTDLPKSAREDLEVIRRNIQVETKLVDALLDVTRIAKGKLQLELDVVNVESAITDAVELCREQAGAQGISVKVQFTAEEKHVRADADSLQQVFWNLIQNAVKFSPRDAPVTLRTLNPQPGLVETQVIDCGIGIYKDQLARLFDAFEQGSAEIVSRYGGLGLGLTLSKALVEAHGGTLRASSAGPGKGATFSVQLRTTGARPTVHSRAAPPAAETARGQNTRILLVEDHPDTRRSFEQLLTMLGYEVEAAGSVQEALALVSQQPFDLLVSDVGLPDGRGTDLMRELVARGSPPPGIALSGYGTREDIALSLEAGFFRHLVKPVQFRDLQAAIREALAARSSA